MANQKPSIDPVKQQELNMKQQELNIKQKELEIEVMKVNLAHQEAMEKMRIEEDKNVGILSAKTAELKTEASLKIKSMKDGNNPSTNLGI